MARPHPPDPDDHLQRPWRVHPLARAEGLALHDVWEVDAALPPGATLGQWADAWRRERQSAATRALFAVRWGLGRLLGLDRDSPGFTLVHAEAEEQLHRIDNRTASGKAGRAMGVPADRGLPPGSGGKGTGGFGSTGGRTVAASAGSWEPLQITDSTD